MRFPPTEAGPIGEGTRPKATRKPSAYNLFLKGKMLQGMTMIDAVKAWKEREAGMDTASMMQNRPGQNWQQSQSTEPA